MKRLSSWPSTVACLGWGSIFWIKLYSRRLRGSLQNASCLDGWFIGRDGEEQVSLFYWFVIRSGTWIWNLMVVRLEATSTNTVRLTGSADTCVFGWKPASYATCFGLGCRWLDFTNRIDPSLREAQGKVDCCVWQFGGPPELELALREGFYVWRKKKQKKNNIISEPLWF